MLIASHSRKEKMMRRHQDQIRYLLELVQHLARQDSMSLLAYLAAVALEENKEEADSVAGHEACLRVA
ncbi:hypothetical protein GB928_015710 [Shinella curvata]|uniref:Uncharacterized protein n=1 Tax=Shinella curvata TaxID=1817964 RepID=A0ABT8XFX5_9HYPH|nr:hypothetical protein [Shinella curvata]MCJ8053307.1 hypothetical protein [Shinella curvata]MDO6122638.1 hypothetical protein [Shinella curvata]